LAGNSKIVTISRNDNYLVTTFSEVESNRNG
jgi:hypothetical protein